LLILAAVPLSKLYKEQVKQRRTAALVRYAPISWCGDSSDSCYDAEIKWLIANGADVNARTASGTPVVRACAEAGHIDTARQLQRAGARLDTQTRRLFQENLTVQMTTALEDGDLPQVKALVAQGADVNATFTADEKQMDSEIGSWTLEGETPLEKAIVTQDVRIVKFLISQGASVRTRRGAMPTLSFALRHGGEAPMLRMLKQAGAPSTPTIEMFIAVIEDRPRDVEKYLNTGISVNATNNGANDSWTPLMWAASDGNARMVRLLLRRGADPNLRDSEKKTALAIASSNFGSSLPNPDFLQTTALLKRVTKP